MLKFLEIGNIVVAELMDENFVVTEVQEMLDLMGDSGVNNFICISHP
jgi:hypothetical protein